MLRGFEWGLYLYREILVRAKVEICTEGLSGIQMAGIGQNESFYYLGPMTQELAMEMQPIDISENPQLEKLRIGAIFECDLARVNSIFKCNSMRVRIGSVGLEKNAGNIAWIRWTPLVGGKDALYEDGMPLKMFLRDFRFVRES